MDLRDYVLDNTGVGIAGITVNRRVARLTGAPGAILSTTTTTVDGMWEFTGLASGLYDVEALYGSVPLWWRAYTAIPQAFGDGQLAAAADIALTKLNQGTANQAITVNGTSTTLDNRISQMVAQLKQTLGTTNWYDAVVAPLTRMIRPADASLVAQKAHWGSTSVTITAGTVSGTTFVSLGANFTTALTTVLVTGDLTALPTAMRPAEVSVYGIAYTGINITVFVHATDASDRTVTVYYLVLGT